MNMKLLSTGPWDLPVKEAVFIEHTPFSHSLPFSYVLPGRDEMGIFPAVILNHKVTLKREAMS